MKHKTKFRTLYLMAGVLPVLILAIVLGIFSMRLINSKVRNGEMEKLEATAANLSEYFAYDIRNNGTVSYEEYEDHAYVNLLKDMDIEQSLFKGDTTFLTSLKDDKGKYLEGEKANAEIWDTVKKGENYTSADIDIDGTDYFVFYTPVYADENQKQIWGMAFAGVPMTEVNSVVEGVRTQIFIIAVVMTVVLSIILVLASRKLTKTLSLVKNNVFKLSQGDISESRKITSFCQEFNDLGNAISHLQQELSDTIISIRDTSQELGDSVKTVDELSINSADGAAQITNVVDQLATTAHSMAESVQQANESIVNMGVSIDSITESASDVSIKALDMKAGNDKALASMKDVHKSNEKSVLAISRINHQTQECNEAVNNIKQAAAVIADIASQTNLLALNASIEAARAGDSGKGFAVVAENIRILAEQSDSSVKEIEVAVMDVVTKVQTCAHMATGAKELMEEQQKLVRNVASGMEELNDNVSEVVKEIQLVTQEAEALDEAKVAVLGNISDLSAISEENAASAEEVNVTIESVAEGISGTKVESGNMRGMAEVLKDKMQFFK